MKNFYSLVAAILLAAPLPSAAQMKFPMQGNETYRLAAVGETANQLVSPKLKAFSPAKKAAADPADFTGRQLY